MAWTVRKDANAFQSKWWHTEQSSSCAPERGQSVTHINSRHAALPQAREVIDGILTCEPPHHRRLGHADDVDATLRGPGRLPRVKGAARRGRRGQGRRAGVGPNQRAHEPRPASCQTAVDHVRCCANRRKAGGSPAMRHRAIQWGAPLAAATRSSRCPANLGAARGASLKLGNRKRGATLTCQDATLHGGPAGRPLLREYRPVPRVGARTTLLGPGAGGAGAYCATTDTWPPKWSPSYMVTWHTKGAGVFPISWRPRECATQGSKAAGGVAQRAHAFRRVARALLLCAAAGLPR